MYVYVCLQLLFYPMSLIISECSPGEHAMSTTVAPGSTTARMCGSTISRLQSGEYKHQLPNHSRIQQSRNRQSQAKVGPRLCAIIISIITEDKKCRQSRVERKAPYSSQSSKLLPRKQSPRRALQCSGAGS